MLKLFLIVQGIGTRDYNSAEWEFTSAGGIYETAAGDDRDERDVSNEIYNTAQLRERRAREYRSTSGNPLPPSSINTAPQPPFLLHQP